MHAHDKMSNKIVASILAFFSFAMSARGQKLSTVPHVDPKRYAGKWYEIAAYPQRFEKGCHCVTAEYTPGRRGHLKIVNTCIKDTTACQGKQTTGKAFIKKNSGNAKLRVQFFWPFRGDYWIIDLADDYSWAVVSEPKKRTLWILSRTPSMDAGTYLAITNKLQAWGFDMTRIRVMDQSCNLPMPPKR